MTFGNFILNSFESKIDFSPEIFALVPIINLQCFKIDKMHLFPGTLTANFPLFSIFSDTSFLIGSNSVTCPGQNFSEIFSASELNSTIFSNSSFDIPKIGNLFSPSLFFNSKILVILSFLNGSHPIP